MGTDGLELICKNFDNDFVHHITKTDGSELSHFSG